MSIGKDREEFEHLSAIPRITEDEHNVHQSRDLREHEITGVWATVEVSASVSLSRDQELINKREGSETDDNKTCRKNESIGLKRTFTEVEWEGNNVYGKEENYYDSHDDTNVSMERRKDPEERTTRADSESHEDTEQGQSGDSCFTTEEIYYDARVKFMKLLKG